MFWPLLRAAQATVVVQAMLGLLLLARGASAPDGLHVIYGIVPLFVSLISEGMRAGVAQRELDGVDDVDALSRAEQVTLARKVALARALGLAGFAGSGLAQERTHDMSVRLQ